MDTIRLNSRSLPVESHVQRETKLNSNKTNRKTTDRKKIREEKAKTKIKSHIIEFRIKNTLLSEREWSSLLQDVVHDKVKIKSTAYRNGDTYCTAETCSSTKAKEAIFAIHMHNRNSDIKILIEVNETVTKSASSPSNYNQVDEIKSTMDKEARNILTKHNKLINSVLQRIDAATCKLKNEPVIKLNTKGGRNELSSKRMHIEEELYALQDKLQELESQKKEFEDFLSCTNDLLGKFKSSKKNTSELKLVYTDFKIEFKHLETALPMYARRTEIVSTVTNNQVSVIVGETGSGKSTQVAKYLYQADLAQRGLIICTQPRKIAATSLATRVAQEMNTSVGNIVGYQVGMQVKRSHATKILYMTDQMLLNQCLKDQKFSQYACIIIDEAHERSVYTDLLLGMIKNCLKIRQDLRVVIMSATIDPEIFVSYFGTCPVIRVAGRTFPVDVIWPSAKDESDNYEQAALEKNNFCS